MKKILCFIIFILLVGIVCAEDTDSSCLDSVPAIYHNGLWWAWASPCSGRCSSAAPEGVSGLLSWRWVAGDDEWALRPSKSLFNMGDHHVGGYCAANFFDPLYDHCDGAGTEVYQLDGFNNELWFVHDACAGRDNDGEVPEFTTIGAGLILVGIGAYVMRKRKAD
ncbi:MAG: hypothetical protein KKF44_07935 [Nanoarchaeota archaeon]|nr:hypothetical protein [Nanoarchaeota archaeon]